MRFPFENQWTIPNHPPSEPDCFVIPSYALKDLSTPTKPTIAQIELAVVWWRQFPNSSLIMCTGDNQGLGITNASVMAAYAVRLGVPAEKVIEEDQSLNTYENLLYAMQIIRERKFRQPTWSPRPVRARRSHRQKWAGMISAAFSLFSGEPAYGYKWFRPFLRPYLYELLAMVIARWSGGFELQPSPKSTMKF
jgi:hypothetical protein